MSDVVRQLRDRSHHGARHSDPKRGREPESRQAQENRHADDISLEGIDTLRIQQQVQVRGAEIVHGDVVHPPLNHDILVNARRETRDLMWEHRPAGVSANDVAAETARRRRRGSRATCDVSLELLHLAHERVIEHFVLEQLDELVHRRSKRAAQHDNQQGCGEQKAGAKAPSGAHGLHARR